MLSVQTNSSISNHHLETLKNLLSNPDRTVWDVLETIPKNQTVLENTIKAWSIINRDYGKPIVVSVSGGADSDIVVDIVAKCHVNPETEVYYVFVDTGLEPKATHRHLDYLEKRYGIKILRERPKKPIPIAVRENGIPFISKTVSEYVERLQKWKFQWEDEDLITLLNRYCKKADEATKALIQEKISHGKKTRWAKVGDEYYFGCVSALMWWCNAKLDIGKTPSRFDIAQNTWLKEFLIQEKGVPFRVSNKCCQVSKKDTIHAVLAGLNPGLVIQGVRKAEGGERATAYKSCFNSEGTHPWSDYRPLFWYLNKDKAEYNEACGIVNSDLYRYQKRTGCAGCPCSRDLDAERNALHQLGEDNMIKAMDNIFGPSYEFTRKYREFQKKMNSKKNTIDYDSIVKEYHQMSIFDFLTA